LYLKPGSSCEIPVPASEKSTIPPDKLDQLLHIVNKLQVEIGELRAGNAALRADNAVLKADNAALKQRVAALEEETQELREAVNGVSFSSHINMFCPPLPESNPRISYIAHRFTL